MAITYTYSFNCTVKYRLSGEDVTTESPLLSDSTNLYICTSELPPTIDNKKVVIPTDLTLPLPNYLQGVEDEIKWYLTRNDNTYSDEVTSGKLENSDSTVSDLTVNKWRTSNAVQTGTFISCDATIILYTDSGQKTIQWKYKQEDTTDTTLTTKTWQPIPSKPADDADEATREKYDVDYANFISLHAPKIPTWVSNKNGSKSTLYVFTKWSDPKEVTKDKEYTIDAVYSETTYDETNPYTLNSANPFADAEPYHYGTGTPSSDYYMPIGEDSNDNNTDIKVQAPENNGYSKINTLNQFKINSKGISYIEVGTFPLLNEVTSVPNAGDYELTINYDTDTTKITTITFNKINCYNAKEKSGPLYEKLKHGNEEFPKRLGFILVGGGGGSGGGGRYDPDKDKKNSHGDFIIPGGGGGGGEIVCGVLDISYETAKKLQDNESPSSLTYKIKVGPGGGAGPHKISDGASSGGHDGDPGANGEDSVIYVQKSSGSNEEFVRACGGFGGGGATNFTLGTGGDGGSYYNSRDVANIASNYNCVIVDTVKGGRGGHPTSQTSVENESLSFSIYFSNTVPPVNSITIKEGDKEKTIYYICNRSYSASSKTYSTDENTDAKVFQTPGGHSFGTGATSGSAAEKGGGGGCFETNHRDGAAGYFGIYY